MAASREEVAEAAKTARSDLAQDTDALARELVEKVLGREVKAS